MTDYQSPRPATPGPADAEPPTPKRSYTAGALIGAAVAALVVGVVIGVVGTNAVSFASKTVASATKPKPTSGFSTALKECGVTDGARTSDGGATLSLNGEGDDDFGGMSYDDESCVLSQLGMPDSITEKMGETRALDGRQSDSWKKYDVSWSYHPDDGLDVIVEFNG